MDVATDNAAALNALKECVEFLRFEVAALKRQIAELVTTPPATRYPTNQEPGL
jgi:hypothetical protein